MAAPAEFETIRLEIAARIATITLHRPEKLNAFNQTMMRELIAAFDITDRDDDVAAVIVTGAGRGFCAGADLSSGAQTFDYDARGDHAGRGAGRDAPRDRGGMVALRIFESLKPVIGAVNGPAVGVGATMLLPMDLRLASTAARFGFVFVRRGIAPEACSSWFLPRLVGPQTALEWCLTGRLFEAEEAQSRGLVRSIHAPEDLLPAARALAREIADNTAPVSVALTRHMIWRTLGADHPMEAHKIESRAVYARGKEGDAHEGVVSFLEKRPARFPNRVSADMPDFFPWQPERPFE